MQTVIAKVESFPLARPFRISRGVKSQADVVAVEIADADGVRGRGEGVPYARYGETCEGALAEIAAVGGALEEGAGRADIAVLMKPGAARNAVDCALWDLELRQGTAALPPIPERIPTAITIVIDTPDAMAAEAAKIAHVPLIKVKVDADNPASAIMAVRAAAPAAALIIDPNEAWDEAIIKGLENVLIDAKVAVLEQPVPAGEDAWLAEYRSPVPICADESVHLGENLDFIATAYQGVNIKLDKTGGLTSALALEEAARARGLKIMSGCMVCSSLSIAPALQIAARADWVDLDGPFWLKQDRAGGVREEDGFLLSPERGFWGEL